MGNAAEAKETFATLYDAVLAFQNTDTFKRFLKFSSGFHQYSFNNRMLIWMANNEATYVASYTDWLNKFGRCVRKGERGYTILAPRFFDKDNGQGGTDRAIYFVTAKTFDYSQTDAIKEGAFEPSAMQLLPEIVDNPNVGGGLYALLKERMAEEGVPVTEADSCYGGAYGLYHPTSKRIEIKHDCPRTMLMTLIHEMAHHFTYEMNLPQADGVDKYSREEAEVIVQSAAYVAMLRVGIDSADFTVPYVAAWLQHDPKSFTKGMTAMQKLSDKIISMMIVEPDEESVAA